MILRYLEDFQRLNTNASNGKSRPYKPALLLAVIEGVESSTIRNRRVYITPELVAAFRRQLIVLGATGTYQSRHFAYPFYHLKNENFWRLKEKPDKKIMVTAANSISGLRQLSEAVDYAQLDVNLWELLVSSNTRNRLRDALLGRYTMDTEADKEAE